MVDLERSLRDHEDVARQTRELLLPAIEETASEICDALRRGGRLITFGNGGSAADAQHLAAELLGHFEIERSPLPALALTTDSSSLTAIANDFAFSEIFARQVEALVTPSDVVLGISTSGNSENVVRGIEAARNRGARTVALTGKDGGRLTGIADLVLVVPSGVTARIQEMHTLIIHLVCERIDEWASRRH